jgi:Fas-associated factor 1
MYAAGLFLSNFELHYDVVHPQFYPGGVHDALRASQSHKRPLLIYLHALHHMDTPAFCRYASLMRCSFMEPLYRCSPGFLCYCLSLSPSLLLTHPPPA